MKSSARTRSRTTRAAERISCRSDSTCRGASGRCTLTTTWSPVGSVARCTWPIDAAAIGVSSKVRNACSIVRPISSSITRRTSANGIGVTSSCRLRSSAMMSGGITSGRVESSWPNLTNVGPSSSSISRSRRPRSASCVLSLLRRRSIRYPKPWRVATRPISDSRPIRRWGFAVSIGTVPPWSATRRASRAAGRDARAARPAARDRRPPRAARPRAGASPCRTRRDGIEPSRSASARQLATASRTALRIASRSIPTRRARSSATSSAASAVSESQPNPASSSCSKVRGSAVPDSEVPFPSMTAVYAVEVRARAEAV